MILKAVTYGMIGAFVAGAAGTAIGTAMAVMSL
jgi:hypothetical protein